MMENKIETNATDAIHHVAIQVKDIQRAIDWYQDNFNTKVTYQDESWALLKFNNLSLALVIPEQHPVHIAIENPEAEKYGQLTKHRDGTESIYIKDSEGNSIEIMKKH